MQELAPQSADGDYVRPSYTFNSRIGDAQFPVRSWLPLQGHTRWRCSPIMVGSDVANLSEENTWRHGNQLALQTCRCSAQVCMLLLALERCRIRCHAGLRSPG